MKRNLFFLLLISLCSCKSTSNNQLVEEISISINPDSTQIFVTGIDPFILKELKSDSLSPLDWKRNISVYLKTKDEDLQDLEKPMEGNFRVQNATVVFKPIKPFLKSKTYIVELYLQNPKGDLMDKLKPSNSPFNQNPVRKEIRFQ